MLYYERQSDGSERDGYVLQRGSRSERRDELAQLEQLEQLELKRLEQVEPPGKLETLEHPELVEHAKR